MLRGGVAGVRRAVEARVPTPKTSELDVDLITRVRDVQPKFLAEWSDLLNDSDARNPFLAPEWQLTWARHFVPDGQLRLVTVRYRDRLLAVAPFHRHTTTVGGQRLLARTLPLGLGAGAGLTELPQVLTRRGAHRKALRAVVAFLMRDLNESNWVELSLGPEQGWFEPEWLPLRDPLLGRCISVHSGTTATVVMDLPESRARVESQLKRNVRESLRRGVNRLHRTGNHWDIQIIDEPGHRLNVAVERLVALHRARATLTGHLPHSDYFAVRGLTDFIRDVAVEGAAAGRVKLCSLSIEGRDVAILMVLRANRSAFFSVSGMDPRWWDASPMTILRLECIRDAIDSGDQTVNFSRGPDAAKLRWSEKLEVHHRFALIAGDAVSRAGYGCYAPYRALSEFRSRARRKVPLDGP